jgi:DnaA family protein
MRQLLLDLLPEAQPTLENFVYSDGNAEALAALTRWFAEEEGECCFFLWGECGAGKTHLLKASGFFYHDAVMDADLRMLADSTAGRKAFAIDHAETLSEAGQQALFNVFNRLRDSGGKLLAAARSAPARLVTTREDLRTRLGSGWIYRLVPLSDAEKADTLRRQAARRAMPLPRDAIDYLLEHAPRDMRTLSALVVALDHYALEAKRPVTLPLLRTLLRRELA